MLNYLQSGFLAGGVCTKENVAIGYAVGTTMTSWGDSKPVLDTNVGAEFDGDNTQDNFTAAAKTAGTAEYAAGKDWGADNAKVPGKVQYYGNTDGGFYSGGSGTVNFWFECSNDQSTYTSVGSDSFANPGDGTQKIINSTDKVTAYRYWRLRSTFPVLNGSIAEIEFFEWKCP